MAQSRYIEIRDGDTWASVSEEFANWLKKKRLTDDFGWSESDLLVLDEEISFFCLSFPERHGEKIYLFEEWAKETGRLYAIKSDRTVVFPNNLKLNFVLPPETQVEVPPWLK